MKQNNCLFSILTTCMLFSFFCCTSEKEEIKVDIKRYAVLLLDENGKLISMTKGVSTLPSGSQVLGTGYYANGDNCTLTYSPAHGYSSTCSWDWHDGTSVQTANSSSSTIRRDYKVTVSETLVSKKNFQIIINTNGNGLWISGAGTYEEGTMCILTAKNGNFDGWYEHTDGKNLLVSTSRNYRFTVTENRMLFAQYHL